MRKTFLWLLWLWISGVIVAAFYYAPLAKGFIGQSSRILFFHVPMAWVSFVAFLGAGVWSLLYLWKRDLRHDRSADAAIQLGLLFGILATVTGAIWARVMWGAFWNWDPRQTTIVISLTFYFGYLVLRSSLEDRETRARLSAAYALLGVAVTPFLYFIVPRITFSLHPDSVVNSRGTIDMESRMVQVLFASVAGFTALFFWMHGLQCRLLARADRKSELRG